MKQLREKTWAKCGATATLLLSCLLLLASCIGILFLSAFQGYDDATGEIAQENALSDALETGKMTPTATIPPSCKTKPQQLITIKSA